MSWESAGATAFTSVFAKLSIFKAVKSKEKRDLGVTISSLPESGGRLYIKVNYVSSEGQNDITLKNSGF
ncbi:MAG: hypothetical protein IT426_15360 [Pirellulales bacterium]|nr:hypothetical protein [Pirellulales bacterium]